MMEHRRRRRGIYEDDSGGDVVLDSDDQERIVRELAFEMERQDKRLNEGFRVVCYGAATVSILSALFVEFSATSSEHARLVRWIQAVLAMALHASALHVATACPPMQQLKWFIHIPAAFLLFFSASSIFYVRKTVQDDESVFLHQGLTLGNFATILGALWLRGDSLAMKNSLHELQSSKYRYKSL